MLIHLGKEIQRKMEEDGRKTSWLAKKLSCDVSKIYRIYDQQYVEAKDLISISIYLDTNFFSHYFEYVSRQIQEKKVLK